MSARFEPVVSLPSASGALELLAAGSTFAVCVRGAVAADLCEGWARAVLAARGDWTVDFGGEQFCLGRAFYTHLETGRAGEYFDHARASDALVERHLPRFQETMRTLAASATGARSASRPGWCGAGVHIFLPESPVAQEGGVVHFDTEGLPEHHVARRSPAISIVLMMQPPRGGGGLRLWPVLYAGDDAPQPTAGEEREAVVVESHVGDAVFFDSYRLHQIQAFAGTRARISATVHAAKLDDRSWETWF